MKFQDSSFNGLKVTEGTKKCDTSMHARSKSNMPHQLFQKSSTWTETLISGFLGMSCTNMQADQCLCFFIAYMVFSCTPDREIQCFTLGKKFIILPT